MKKLAQGFNTAAQDLNPGSRSRESEALPLSHCALHCVSQGREITAPQCSCWRIEVIHILLGHL